MNQTDPATITSDAQVSHQDNHCYLLELPGELRNEVFALALYYPEGITINLESETEKKRTSHPLALTMRCKQIRQECGDIFSDMNEVTIQLPFRKWIEQIIPAPKAPVDREQIRQALEPDVSTTLCDKNIPTNFPTNLKNLRLDISQYGPDIEILQELQRQDAAAALLLDYFGEVVIYDFPIDNSENYVAATDKCFNAAKYTGPYQVMRGWVHDGFRDVLVRLAVSEIQAVRERGWSGRK
ncbi:hypothetical protein LTR37_003571 [Vermiconidia calcicola]|uniref:Uncharacterized protein n=1 Tax=Vermiconidia calcicola TaxID=1690605 RepID=A0ACC3NSI5_9PEZI|nr:hypothetical protein LTR37_003571 [Vermiconidia calcicola]